MTPSLFAIALCAFALLCCVPEIVEARAAGRQR